MRRSRGARVGAALVLALAAVAVVGLPVAQAGAGSRDDSPVDHNPIVIRSDAEFLPANGVRAGNGSKDHPFVISGWKLSSLTIADTDSYVVIRDNVIENQLTLNWNGDRVELVHNNIGDLRVNENVERTGMPTDGVIAHNTFGIVGQLRHFDGKFQYNKVTGEGAAFDKVFGTRAVNFDGFNGAHFRYNEIHGFMDATLHGHHHSSGFGEPSHMHAYEHDHGDMVDHSDRYHEVWITDNTIYADGSYALRWNDVGHAGNDRTAASEQNKALNGMHIHHTRIHLLRNKLVGAGLMVDVFNADDEHHTGTTHGLIDIRDNTISLTRDATDLFSQVDGISLGRVKDAEIWITGNKVTNSTEQGEVENPFSSDSGISLFGVDKAEIYLYDNSVSGVYYGVRASDMSESVYWYLRDLRADNVTETVAYDSSVKNKPERTP